MQQEIQEVKDLFGGEGEVREVGSNAPWEITGSDDLWAVEKGYVDLFLFDPALGMANSRRTYLLTVEAGEIIPQITLHKEVEKQVGIVAVAGPETIVRSLPRSRVEEIVETTAAYDLHHAFAIWIAKLSRAVELPPVPRASVGIKPGDKGELPAGQTAHALPEIVWIHVKKGFVKLVGIYPVPTNEELTSPYPLGGEAWVKADENSFLEVCDTQTIAQARLVTSSLDLFHEHVFRFLVNVHQQALEEERKDILKIKEVEAEMSSRALNEIASVMQVEFERELELKAAADPYVAVCELIGKQQEIVFKTPPERVKIRTGRYYVSSIARASGVRYREVTLTSNWWNNDAGPIFGFLKEGRRPVALLPQKGGYMIVDPQTSAQTKVTSKTWPLLDRTAYIFYRPFPNRALKGRDILRFAFNDLKPELIRIAFTAACIGLLGLLTPLITNLIFSNFVPEGEAKLLVEFAAFLAGTAVATTLIQIAQNMAMLRIEGKAGSHLQAALWDRLMGMPASFFRKFSSGELASRAMGFDALRRLLTGTVTGSILTLISSLFSFGLLFKFDVKLALVAFVIILITIGVLAASTVVQLRFQKEQIQLGNKVTGFVFQLLNGIAKLRVADAEGRALDKWAILFAKQKKIVTKARTAQMRLETFNSGWDVLRNAIIFWFAAKVIMPTNQLYTGEFIAFQSAFGQFFGAMMGVSSIIATLVQAGPIYQQTKPILDAVPEVTPDKVDPGELEGRIEVNHVQFRYDPDLPLVLDDVSIKMEPGEFVALVGPSGAGKSSLFRLILGFDKPETGTVYFDGQDLDTLDVQAVRRQIGVVIQNAKISPGDIFTNIVGSLPYSIDDAWHAAEMTGLAEDIRRMPMGMHTYISEEGGSLSGGQKQRLIIARSLIGRPKVLLFDEATSALDNHTQAIVTRSVEQLHATRFVIAHRLTTIEKADRIYVLFNKKIVQEGTYAELLRQPGLFQELAKRQLA